MCGGGWPPGGWPIGTCPGGGPIGGCPPGGIMPGRAPGGGPICGGGCPICGGGCCICCCGCCICGGGCIMCGGGWPPGGWPIGTCPGGGPIGGCPPGGIMPGRAPGGGPIRGGGCISTRSRPRATTTIYHRRDLTRGARATPRQQVGVEGSGQNANTNCHFTPCGCAHICCGGRRLSAPGAGLIGSTRQMVASEPACALLMAACAVLARLPSSALR